MSDLAASSTENSGLLARNQMLLVEIVRTVSVLYAVAAVGLAGRNTAAGALGDLPALLWPFALALIPCVVAPAVLRITESPRVSDAACCAGLAATRLVVSVALVVAPAWLVL